jgi:hypothetical protein
MLYGTKSLLTILALAALGGCAAAAPAPSASPQTPGPAPAEVPASGEPTAAAGASSDGHEHPGAMMPGGGMSEERMAGMCPMRVEGTKVTASDVDGGIALAFATSTGDVSELRQRVQHMADMHKGSGEMRMGGPTGGAAGHQGMMMSGGMMNGMMGDGMMMPAATATVEEVPGGSRIILRPKDPAKLEALREHAHKCSERMQSGQCPMMGAQAAATPAIPPAPEK